MSDIVALTGRYMPKLAYLTTKYVIANKPVASNEDII